MGPRPRRLGLESWRLGLGLGLDLDLSGLEPIATNVI